ncbi:MAG TPA: hypothetical protein VLM85_00915 [Polyangiaceae bacterium]|nr:hypothetical protein [Polyangiaceae bacterium]
MVRDAHEREARRLVDAELLLEEGAPVAILAVVVERRVVLDDAPRRAPLLDPGFASFFASRRTIAISSRQARSRLGVPFMGAS